MTISAEIIITILAAAVPSLLSTLILFYIKKRDAVNTMKQVGKDKTQITFYRTVLKGLSVSLELGEATAIALKNQTFNGELETARANARTVDSEIHLFMLEQSAQNLQHS